MRQNILVVLLICILLASGFIWFRYMRDASPAGQALGAADTSERIEQYKQLQNLKPDLSIFIDPLFRSLERTLPSPTGGPPALGTGDIRAGRTNPFNPLSGE